MNTDLKSALTTSVYDPNSQPESIPKSDVVDFLFHHLEQYGDPKAHISAALEYAISATSGKGGFVVVGRLENKIVGAVIVNNTGMKGFIPENILVYIAVDSTQRGLGIGKSLMKAALQKAEGAVALHVEPDNPARKLYEKLGFTNKYLEMRYYPDH